MWKVLVTALSGTSKQHAIMPDDCEPLVSVLSFFRHQWEDAQSDIVLVCPGGQEWQLLF